MRRIEVSPTRVYLRVYIDLSSTRVYLRVYITWYAFLGIPQSVYITWYASLGVQRWVYTPCYASLCVQRWYTHPGMPPCVCTVGIYTLVCLPVCVTGVTYPACLPVWESVTYPACLPVWKEYYLPSMLLLPPVSLLGYTRALFPLSRFTVGSERWAPCATVLSVAGL